jgi:hypothetical protein
MATLIEQKPSFQAMPVGQDVIFAVSNNPIVANQTKVKFIAEVHISREDPPNLSTNDNKVGTFKITPNNKGVGIFDFTSVVENYVKADNMGSMSGNGSDYKGNNTLTYRHAIHLIDKYSRNDNNVCWLAIQFKLEYLGAEDCAGQQDDNTVRVPCSQAVNSANYMLWNGYIKETDVMTYSGANKQNFGYDWKDRFLLNSTTQEFLTNAPATQYANDGDYGTIGFITPEIYNQTVMDRIKLRYYTSAGVSLGTETVMRSWDNGAFTGGLTQSFASLRLQYFGCFPGNLRNWSTNFQALITAESIQGGYYTVQAYNNLTPVSQLYTIQVNCPRATTLDGSDWLKRKLQYDPIRLCWLNQWGVWDYFTFNKKSTTSIKAKGSTYTQLAGTWNESTFKKYGYKGGEKTFRVNAKEVIKMNTDFISPDNNTMLEELINSPEVYMLDSFHTDPDSSTLNTYVTPVRLTTSNFTKKTVGNDRLIQYTFEVEKSKTLRTQSI